MPPITQNHIWRHIPDFAGAGHDDLSIFIYLSLRLSIIELDAAFSIGLCASLRIFAHYCAVHCNNICFIFCHLYFPHYFVYNCVCDIFLFKFYIIFCAGFHKSYYIVHTAYC